MITAKKNGRLIGMMLLTEPVNDVLGVVQCMIDGCEANMPIMAGPDEAEPGEQAALFLETHTCDPTRYRDKPKRH